MKRRLPLFVTVCLLAAIGIHGTLEVSLFAESEKVLTSHRRESTPSPFVGSQSCATAACHGSLIPESDPKKMRFDEYHVWLDDPHAGAGQTLSSLRSRQIFKNLGVMSPNGDVNPDQRSTFEKVWDSCAACHSPLANEMSQLTTAVAEGVSCEACHGAAQQWVHRHYRADWKSLTSDQKTNLGYVDTGRQVAQARMCSECHVGSEGRVVTHDLIAAGHPAMRYEWIWYRDRLPAHWKKESKSDDILLDWLIGQATSAEADLKLLELRANRALQKQTEATWPEFSQYRCFSCHHDLNSDTFRAERGFVRGNGKILFPWEPWSFALIPEMARTLESSESNRFAEAAAELRKTMDRSLIANPNQVSRQAAECLTELNDWLMSLARTRNDGIDDTLKSIVEKSENRASWDRSAHLFQAAAAMSRATGQSDTQKLIELRDALAFPEVDQRAFDSPRQFSDQESLNRLIQETFAESHSVPSGQD